MVCSKCGREYGDWEMSCPSCGAIPGDAPGRPAARATQPQSFTPQTLGGSARCPQCGAGVEQWATHCPSCGAAVMVDNDGVGLRGARGTGARGGAKRRRRSAWWLLLLLPCLLPCVLPMIGKLLAYRLVEHLPYPGAMAHNPGNRPGMVVVVIDVSLSMSGGKLDSAKEGAQTFIDALDDQDYVQVLAFSDDVQPLNDFTEVGPNRPTIKQQIAWLSVMGGTRIAPALDAAALSLTGGPDQRFFKGIVLLSDGMDPMVPDPNVVAANTNAHIYTICFGADADVQYLTELGRATDGWCASGTEVNIGRAYEKIALIF